MAARVPYLWRRGLVIETAGKRAKLDGLDDPEAARSAIETARATGFDA
jgi:hypothetical protein